MGWLTHFARWWLASAATAPAPPRTVIVELFTSEGCSSCPPAEALVTELRNEARKDHRAVFFLSEHVDYWDRGGWRDPFSSADATERQKEESEHLSANALYTPEMIVDGRVAFVGSDRAQAKQEIEHALDKNDNTSLRLEAVRSNRNVSVDVELFDTKLFESRLSSRLYLQVAAVEDRTVDIEGGENSGRTLHHPAVVRVMKEIHLQGKKTHLAFELPADSRPNEIIAFVESDNGVEGAASVPLN